MCNVSSHIKGHQAIRFVVGAMPILFGLYACAAPSNPVVNAVEPDYAHIGAKEVELLTGSGGRARRMGDDVILTFDNGGTKTLHNDNKGCQDGPGHCDSYILAADLPSFHWFLVYEAFYEGGNVYLIDDRAGRETQLPYFPVFSPDGQRILIQNDDVSSSFPGDNFEIWRRDGTRAVREWGFTPTPADTGVPNDLPYHSEVQSWRGDRIVLTLSIPGAYNVHTKTSAPGRSWTGTLTRTTDGWHLHAHAPIQ